MWSSIYQGIDGASVVMCILANRNLWITIPSLLQHNPCHIEQLQPFNREKNSLGRGENKEEIDAMLDFVFHFPIKLEFLYCRLSPRTINANSTIDNRFDVQLAATWFLVFVFLPAFLTCLTTAYLWYVLDGRLPCTMWVLLCIDQ